MKKYVPYIFPALAVLLVSFLVFRWYRLNTLDRGEITPFAEGVDIENLSQDEVQANLPSNQEFDSVDLEEVNTDGSGSVKYAVADGKLRFTVYAALPHLDEGQYQVWLRSVDGSQIRKAFVLEEKKGGYIGSAAIDASVLPFELVVSRETRPDDEMETEVLRVLMEQTLAN